MSLGTGYEYLLSSVVRGDGAVAPSTPLTRYYAESGTPPGRWLGSGLAALNDGVGLAEGAVVTEEQLFHLLGMLCDPGTGQPLGSRPLRLPPPMSERIRLRVGQLPAGMPSDQRAVAVAAIEEEEVYRERAIRRPVAGFDLTFSVPKSVSVVWALADGATQATIYRAHQDAIRIALDYAEQHIFFSRSGHAGAVQEPIRGVIAAAFDHWDSRAGDPHLHTHLVVANRVQTLDGLWRTLDSKTLHKYVVALSELHEGVLQDLLTDRLGYAWEQRDRAHSAVPRWDIAGVPAALLEEFSRRSVDIDSAAASLVADFARTRGHHPSSAEVLRLRQHATLQTRPDKEHHSLVEQAMTWRERARPLVTDHTVDTAAWIERLRGQAVVPALCGAEMDTALLDQIARDALQTVAAKRATFSHANVLAEVHRQLHGLSFASPRDRISVAAYLTDAALADAVLLSAPHRVAVGAQVWTTREILDAESRLLDAGRSLDGPDVPADVVTDVLASNAPDSDHRLGPDQLAAVHAIATSERDLDVLVGPAGTGKTTCLAALRRVWEHEHGAGSVTGLAPSAAAAQVLSEELGIPTENTAKWLHEQAGQDDRLDRMATLIDQINARDASPPGAARSDRLEVELGEILEDYERWSVRLNQLVIVDEADLEGTLTLDRLVAEARDAGGKVLLVGDWAQLGAIDAGGAFAMLVNDRPDAPELGTVRRFDNAWERDASLQLRVGDESAIASYTDHDRIRCGDRTAMLDQLYRAWRDDTNRGLTSLMIATDHDSVAELNQRARADRIATGDVEHHCVPISHGSVTGVGDRIVTRHNDRHLPAGRGWVRNGDTWTVSAIRPDGSLTARRDSDHAAVDLPADYVASHVGLGYATTAHRAQGRTVDTAHALIGPTATRESLYVAATRGRSANTIYLDTNEDDDLDTSHDRGSAASPDQVLARVLARTNSDTAAHTALARELLHTIARETAQRATLTPTVNATTHPHDQAPLELNIAR